MNSMTELDSKLQGAKSIGIAGHVRPDGDCAGSTLAVYNYIKNNYPEADTRIFLEPIPNIFKFLQRSEEIISDYPLGLQFDLFISLDCGDTGRLGRAADYFRAAGRTVCIDHHVSNQAFADDNYIFPDASSTCELVYKLLDKDKITKEIAECLYTGIVHDTGVFQYSCTSAGTMNIAGKLMDCGIDYSRIIDETFYTKTYNQNRILGQALLKSRLYLDGQVIVSVITAEDMKMFDVLPKHLDGIVNQLRVTKGVRVAVFIYETEDGSFKVSTRASDDTDLAQLAVQFGGGGHVKAAGFTMQGQILDIVDEVVAALQSRFQDR